MRDGYRGMYLAVAVRWRGRSRSLPFSVPLLGVGCVRDHSGTGVPWGMGGGCRGHSGGLVSGLVGEFHGLVGTGLKRCRSHVGRLIYWVVCWRHLLARRCDLIRLCVTAAEVDIPSAGAQVGDSINMIGDRGMYDIVIGDGDEEPMLVIEAVKR
jgi:hypothetical protein